MGDKIVNLPNTILDGIKGIFVPDEGAIEQAFYDFLRELEMKFNFNTEFFKGLFFDPDGTPLEGSAVTDVKGEYEIPGVGKFNLTFMDSEFLYQGVEFFRPFIRGFIVLLLFMFHINSVLSLIGQDGGIKEGKEIGQTPKFLR